MSIFDASLDCFLLMTFERSDICTHYYQICNAKSAQDDMPSRFCEQYIHMRLPPRRRNTGISGHLWSNRPSIPSDNQVGGMEDHLISPTQKWQRVWRRRLCTSSCFWSVTAGPSLSNSHGFILQVGAILCDLRDSQWHLHVSNSFSTWGRGLARSYERSSGSHTDTGWRLLRTSIGISAALRSSWL